MSEAINNDLYAVVGNPINHSKSPQIHSLFARQTGQTLEYTAIKAPVDEFAEVVTDFFSNGGGGLNVTVPFKEQAWALATERTERAQKAGAANTLYINSAGSLTADNTDGVGLVNDLLRNHKVPLKGVRILILGAGGAVRGVLGPLLAEKPASITIANRTLARAEALVELFADDAATTQLDSCAFTGPDTPFDVIINGTSASLQGNLPPLSADVIGSDTVIYDMMYAVTTTVFNQWALDHGAEQVFDGLGMLVEQAAEAFFVWRGVRPETEAVMQQLRR